MRANTGNNAVIFLIVLLMTAVGVGVLHSAPNPLSGNKAITAFTIAGAIGTIDEKTITVDLTSLPLFTRIDALVATFRTNGKAVRVGSKNQVSGKTANDFIKPVLYTVTAADGSTGDFAVRVLVGKVAAISGYSDTMIVGSDGSLFCFGKAVSILRI